MLKKAIFINIYKNVTSTKNVIPFSTVKGLREVIIWVLLKIRLKFTQVKLDTNKKKKNTADNCAVKNKL